MYVRHLYDNTLCLKAGHLMSNTTADKLNHFSAYDSSISIFSWLGIWWCWSEIYVLIFCYWHDARPTFLTFLKHWTFPHVKNHCWWDVSLWAINWCSEASMLMNKDAVHADYVFFNSLLSKRGSARILVKGIKIDDFWGNWCLIRAIIRVKGKLYFLMLKSAHKQSPFYLEPVLYLVCFFLRVDVYYAYRTQ